MGGSTSAPLSTVTTHVDELMPSPTVRLTLHGPAPDVVADVMAAFGVAMT